MLRYSPPRSFASFLRSNSAELTQKVRKVFASLLSDRLPTNSAETGSKTGHNVRSL
jgi:hypothetical protein